jgi:hypothetical protein
MASNILKLQLESIRLVNYYFFKLDPSTKFHSREYGRNNYEILFIFYSAKTIGLNIFSFQPGSEELDPGNN